MSSLFISYSSFERQQATLIYDYLTQLGYQLPFLDYHPDSGIPGGSYWRDELRWQLKISRGMVILLSDHWLKSEWCKDELVIAKLLNKYF